jgi:hypothetical protein
MPCPHAGSCAYFFSFGADSLVGVKTCDSWRFNAYRLWKAGREGGVESRLQAAYLKSLHGLRTPRGAPVEGRPHFDSTRGSWR